MVQYLRSGTGCITQTRLAHVNVARDWLVRFNRIFQVFVKTTSCVPENPELLITLLMATVVLALKYKAHSITLIRQVISNYIAGTETYTRFHYFFDVRRTYSAG